MIRAIMTAALLMAACGDDGGSGKTDGGSHSVVDADPTVDALPDAMPREVVHEMKPLQPGELVEGILTGGPADKALILLVAPTAKMAWNIHSHPSNQTIIAHEEFNVKNVAYVFVPETQADWYFLIRNDDSVAMNVDVTVQLHGAATWRWE